ncbi:N-acetylmuramoyl-L-alanine amidase [Candidatus Berkiella aquae]|uniref:N-acetylmuramoyl-L-alanine amidase AmiC n=2 Tax=Candidatus Berkiella aquae TaxID=295108 RepID=A0AAE3HV94_9GAMM|nr:N-acetylmuramoyl-L-alanine amidase [Candidatus Berkiella aquae]MCS5710169.1 N-acetylmuramoyl-L-alanine amidase [Candidatus Berkiella aquae]
MMRYKHWVAALLLTISSSSVWPAQKIESLRVWASPESTRIVLDLSGEVKYKLFILENPYRAVLDIADTELKSKLDETMLEGSGIKRVRYAHENGRVRIVFDLDSKATANSFILSPNQSYNHRLVVDLAQAIKTPAIVKADAKKYSTREFIVAIDPGHGGDDTGAIGLKKKLREKDVVFAVSKKLEALINAQKGMRAYLIRSGDYYVGLRKRMSLAREQGADLFISVHADSFNDPRASGASVYVLSEKGASNEASRWLAERENRADLVGGISLEDKGDVLASVLLDLSQTASRNASQELAAQLIANLGKVTDLHHKSVQRAGFMVLKSPDIPSVLVELGFISNHKGEEKLAHATHQQALANALLTGIKSYAAKRSAPVKHDDSNMAHRNNREEVLASR